MDELPEYVDGIPNICGSEAVVDTAIKAAIKGPVFLREDSVPFGGVQRVCYCFAYASAIDPGGRC